MFDAERTAFLESGLAILVGSRSREHVPDCVRAFACKVLAKNALRLWVVETQATTLFQNLDDNGAVAVSLTRVTDYESIQAKGRYVARRAANDEERAFVEAQKERFRAGLAHIGYEPKLHGNMRWWPCASFDVEVTELFCQTPGPRAGERL